MGAETQDSHGKLFVLVVPDVSVYDPAMSDSLFPEGRLIKAGFTVHLRIPFHPTEDGFPLKTFPVYSGTITTPDRKTIIVMEYAQHTWRIPLPSNKRVSKPKTLPRATSENFVDLRSAGSSFIDPSNSFHILDEIDNVDDEGYVPSYLTENRIEGCFQQRCELMLQRREMAEIYHTSHGHCNNRQTVLNLLAKGIECNHLQRYILAHRCDACDAAPGCRHHKVKATKKVKRKAKSIWKTAAPVATDIAPVVDSLPNPHVEQLDLELSTLTDAIDPTVTIAESLARLFQHTSKNPSDYPDITQMRNMSVIAKDTANYCIDTGTTGEGTTGRIVGSEGDTANANDTTPLFSPPGTDSRMDWGHACSLGCLPNLNKYFLLVMDKGTEYFVSYPTKTRASPLALLKQFVTLTSRKIRFLRIDCAKEFQSEEIREYCADNDVVLQLVVAYNHTMQARVEGAIGCVKQHSRTSLLHANKATRFWDDATKDFSIKRVYLWASTDTQGKLQTPHDCMQPAFFNTYKTFGS